MKQNVYLPWGLNLKYEVSLLRMLLVGQVANRLKQQHTFHFPIFQRREPCFSSLQLVPPCFISIMPFEKVLRKTTGESFHRRKQQRKKQGLHVLPYFNLYPFKFGNKYRFLLHYIKYLKFILLILNGINPFDRMIE